MSEEQAQQLMQQMQMLETYFSDLSQRETTFLSVLREASSAIESIKSLNQKSESDTLIPIGMGTYVPTKISSTNKIVLNVGAGVAVEKDFPSAINYLEARIKEIEVALQDNSAKKQDAAASLEQGREQINQLMQSTQPPN
ncbi:prefoldin subunit alpha [Nitrosopumilus sp.]|uniref:prefoldin subunit alpha n=1 Tax=Nitrosopumilus sp. TaxID=2024843 RepID=UPI003B5A8B0E